ncbi:MAG: membrane protein insertion efficiency factor YidD [Deltaproteobacteria bacterium]|nr:MAG: membrane protein insertion efficiency factor YidD [Deltaproteobacteria bacterium]
MIRDHIINLIRIYQKVAPVRLRTSCRFKPSCSEYMILSLYKYGFFTGLIKGLSRIFRCKAPNGGTDYP